MPRPISHLALLRQPRSSRAARELRSNLTKQEGTLWYYLRAKRFANAKFRRQVPIGPYVVDFLCERARLIIEIDGGQHFECRAADEQRTQCLATLGYRVIRFWNNEVNESLGSVLQAIADALADPLPGPLPREREA